MSPAQRQTFDRFWASYPRKVGKLAAQREWARRQPDLDTVLAALAWQTEKWHREQTPPQFIPHPRTWLHQGRDLDQPDTPIVATTREFWGDECRRVHGENEHGMPVCGNVTWHTAQMSARRAV